jgi:hypothetical protein
MKGAILRKDDRLDFPYIGRFRLEFQASTVIRLAFEIIWLSVFS